VLAWNGPGPAAPGRGRRTSVVKQERRTPGIVACLIFPDPLNLSEAH